MGTFFCHHCRRDKDDSMKLWSPGRKNPICNTCREKQKKAQAAATTPVFQGKALTVEVSQNARKRRVQRGYLAGTAVWPE